MTRSRFHAPAILLLVAMIAVVGSVITTAGVLYLAALFSMIGA